MVQTENKKAKEELEKRGFQVKNIIIAELSEMKATELTGKKGKEKLQDTLKTRIKELMEEGKVEKVYITSSILQ
jgi:flagellar FliL protein